MAKLSHPGLIKLKNLLSETDWSRNDASHAVESQLAKVCQKLNIEERISCL